MEIYRPPVNRSTSINTGNGLQSFDATPHSRGVDRKSHQENEQREGQEEQHNRRKEDKTLGKEVDLNPILETYLETQKRDAVRQGLQSEQANSALLFQSMVDESIAQDLSDKTHANMDDLANLDAYNTIKNP